MMALRVHRQTPTPNAAGTELNAAVTIVPFCPKHLVGFLPRLCTVHRKRAEAVAPLADVVDAALQTSSHLATAMVDGRAEAVMGMVLTPDAGHPWLLKTPDAERHYRQLVRHCRAFIAGCHQDRAVLRADVEPQDRTLQRWLRWLGFVEIGPHERWTRWERCHGN